MTPKLGLIYAPTPDIDVKGSWGRSFRAPTLLQQFQPSSILLDRPAFYGGSGFPASATVLLLQGGNPALRPERARTWSATLAVHPRGLDGFSAELSYFSIRYRDRIVLPIALTSIALNNPAYRDYVALDPSETVLADIIAAAGTFINASGGTYDPANVVAIINNTNVNAGRQRVEGVDLLVRYRRPFGGDGRAITATLNATYLDSEQQLASGQPILPLAGTLFNPPHWRARGSLGWRDGPLGLTATISHIGSVEDVRFTPSPTIDSMTTVDLAAIYRGGGTGWLGGIELSVSALNIFNDKPAPIATSVFTDTPYDSTNYSPVGRYLSFGITKRW